MGVDGCGGLWVGVCIIILLGVGGCGWVWVGVGWCMYHNMAGCGWVWMSVGVHLLVVGLGRLVCCVICCCNWFGLWRGSQKRDMSKFLRPGCGVCGGCGGCGGLFQIGMAKFF